MNKDLKLIKKLYGESMSHFCRSTFSSILEKEGILPKILQDNFYPSHNLYKDLENSNLLSKFKIYIYSKFHQNDKIKEQIDLSTPEKLMKQVGYVLYECKTEEEIQRFKKYYAEGEQL